ncbi:carbon-nitrogen hydrolase family protein [Thermomonospora catenispora]|uniref:carbon-nitrogen hydrolase family protein n=1 Tax=Thermomonospora catenispora TaxID=2493090 RepID=UPI00111F5D28|nr:carbon-nitrogen hydrolase family protein [Thermomonospora catenispora]TNY34982.1 carbon-nitrogen hydrolase family protein [Thermomonospora catenispora]
MRRFIAAAVQLAPAPGPLTAASVDANLDKAQSFVRRCVAATGAELVVLPESCTTGFTPGVPVEELWSLVSAVPGPITEPLQQAARELGVHVCMGTYERGAGRGAVHNAAVLIGPAGDVLGVYRKTHPFGAENAADGGWTTPGTDVCVVDTGLGRIGMAVCFDGDFPELWRIQAVRGAEVICRPSALLRSADVWELTNRARAYDNHVHVIGANAVGADPAGTLYFGNSMIVTPIAEVVARAATHESWTAAELDPDRAMASLSPGSSVPQSFDHLAARNLELYDKHAADLLGPARTPFPHGPAPGGAPAGCGPAAPGAEGSRTGPGA